MRAHFNKKGEPTGYSEKVPKYLQPGFLSIFGTVIGLFLWVFIFIPATIYLWNKSKGPSRSWIIVLDMMAILLWITCLLMD